LQVARKGLHILGNPVVRRTEGVEGSALVVLTMQTEELAYKLGEPGASARDLSDAVEILRSLLSSPKGLGAGFKPEWVAYLEARLEHTRDGGPSRD
jgi:hypothetical protein